MVEEDEGNGEGENWRRDLLGRISIIKQKYLPGFALFSIVA